MTFNIRYGTADDGENSWPNRRDLVFEIFRQHRPDVVGLQEALRFQIDEIRQEFPEYGEVGVGRDDGKTAGEYSAILYLRNRFQISEEETFWFSDTPDQPGSKHWGNEIPRICTWASLTEKRSQRAFYIYNVHLDHMSQPSREKSTTKLSEQIAQRTHRDPVVVTGDFNADEDNPAISLLGEDNFSAADNSIASPRLIDTFRAVNPEADSVRTFHAFSGDVIGEKIDYVFVQPDAQVIFAEIIRYQKDGRYPSDHFPVVAKILLPRASN